MRAVWILLALVACKRGHEPAAPSSLGSGSGIVAEPQLGPPNPGGERELAFVITKVYDAQKPTSAPPYHAAGGTWTYVDAALATDPAATFGFGMPALESGSDGFGGFAKMWLVPTTSEAGHHFLVAFVKAFHVALPRAYPGTLAPLRVPIAVLGVSTNATELGYSGQGTWDATKMFLSADNIDSAELFFNVSISGKRGAFSEKDEDYDQDDANVLAIALRDGAPPPRTPENDPTLAARPLTLQVGKQVGGRMASPIGSSSKRAILTETLEDHAVLTVVDLATGEVKEPYRTPDRLWMGMCDASAEHCVVQETRSANRHAFASNDPAKLLALDGVTVTTLNVPGAGTSPGATAISPGGRYVIVSGDKATTIVLDRKTGKATAPEHHKEYREVIGWKSEAVALVSLEDLGDSGAEKTYAAWHLDTNKLESLAAAPARGDGTSPDGTRTLAVGDGKVTVTPKGGTARTLQLDPRDARVAEADCCKWLDSRYVSFPAKTLGVIDTDAMKIAFAPASRDDEEPRIIPLAGSMQALVTKGDDLFLAKIVP